MWDGLGEVVGKRQRAALMNELVRRYLAGEPMPPRPDRD
jgi:hypothetical protein